MKSNTLLELRNVKTYYLSENKGGFLKKKHCTVKAVNDVSFTINSGEAVGLVGESGCGKSTLARTILKLAPLTDGKIIFNGTDITNLTEKQFKTIRKKLQIIFQDPYSSLNPRMTVKQIIAEPLIEHRIVPKDQITAEISRLMNLVGLSHRLTKKFPHEFSGGQRQRVAIARALALRPELLIADEPVSALDVSIQAQILNLIKELQQSMNLTLLFISHNLAVVKHVCTKIIVMKSGQIVEYGNREKIFERPENLYTKALIQAIPCLKSH